ncbi:MAG: S41 family peptidase [Gemmatimonadaceae bacterium]
MRLAILTVLLAIAHVAGAQGGLWTSEGYGLFFDTNADTLRAYEVTSISCIPSFTAAAVPAPTGAVAAYRFTTAPVTVLLLRDQSPNGLRFHINGAASDVILRRAARPSACERPTPNTPVSNFDVFATTWAEQYGFFDIKHADWASIVAGNRPNVSDTTSDPTLFAVLRGMIEPLHDAHTYIGASDPNLRFSGFRPSPDRVPREQWDSAYATVQRYLIGPLHTFCNGRLEFGMLRPDIGYLRIRGFSTYTPNGSFDDGLVALEAALDTIFAGSASWRGFVTDVRINGGGADPYGLAIASRLTAKDYIAYEKQARLDPKDPSRWTPGQVSWVRVSNRPGFRGPVVHLTSTHSVSAAETFTQALMNRQPAVVRIGQNTQGVFSDVLGRHLPNGWRFGLPNERFVTNGKSYDGPGIPPMIVVPVFPPSDVASGRDGAIEKALEVLGATARTSR